MKLAEMVSSCGTDAFTCSQVARMLGGRRGVSRTRSSSNMFAVATGKPQGHSVWDPLPESSVVLCNGGASSLRVDVEFAGVVWRRTWSIYVTKGAVVIPF